MSSSARKIKRLEADVVALHKENDFLSRTRKKANAEIEELKKKLSQTEERLAEYELPNSPGEKITHKKCEAEMDKLRDQLVKQQNHIFKIDERLRDQQKAKRDLEARLKAKDSEHKKALEEVMKKHLVLEDQMKGKKTRISFLERDCSQKQSIIQKLSNAKTEAAALGKENAKLKKEIKTSLESSRELENSVKSKDEKIERMTSELDGLEKELVEVKEKLESSRVSTQQKEDVVFEDCPEEEVDFDIEETEVDPVKLPKEEPLKSLVHDTSNDSPPVILNTKKKKRKTIEVDLSSKSKSPSHKPVLKVKTDLGKRKRPKEKETAQKRRRISSRMRDLQKWIKHRVEWKRHGNWLRGAVFRIISDTTIRLLLDDGKMTDVKIDQLNQTWRWEEDAYYEINKIISERFDRKRKKKLYKVSWKGFGKEDDSWVEEGNLTKMALDEWKAKKNRRK